MKESHNRGEPIRLELSPVGVKILSDEGNERPDVDVFEGVSFCQAVGEATTGRPLIVGPSSITVCKWAPVVLGFKEAEDSFEKTISQHLPPFTSGLYLAPVSMFERDAPPEVVILRTTPEKCRLMIKWLGWDNFIDYRSLEQDLTALNSLSGHPPQGLSGWLIRNVNRWLDQWNRFDWWHRFTTFLFKSWIVTRIFDRFNAKFMANMSMCRNSLVVPFLSNKANISYFCTGGIAWGKNSSRNMTVGLPFEVYQDLAPHLTGKGTSC